MERLVERSIRDKRFAAAMYVLLDELRDCIRVYGDTPERDKDADHYSAEWLASVTEGGAPLVVINALRENPALWREAMGNEVVLIPRSALEAIVKCFPISPELGALGVPSVEALEYAGQSLLEHIASVRRAKREEAEAAP